MRLTPALCRAGRALIDWTQDRLARAAGVSRSTVREFEKGHHALQRGSEEAIILALESAGVELICDRRGAEGVRFRQPATHAGNPTVRPAGDAGVS